MRREVEVQYKDFKVTELLDIKMPGQASSGKEAGKQQEKNRIPGDTQRQENKPANKGSRLALVGALILLAAACGYYLLKLLMKF
ncbi:MAG: hypothetical protein M0Z71_04520 [Nitrospiraceae bacterium]|nr:hypothetical protein [Nitrospiraceae bacterium]